MTDFLIATHNLKKRDELGRILAPLGISVLIDSQAGVTLSDVEETGKTFEENALLKAENGAAESLMPCIADDSGLCVDALDGAPGIYSARYAGEHGNDGANIIKLLDALKDVPAERRTARFVCAACCVWQDGRREIVRGECEGRIAFAPAGDGGFGYDPIFLPAAFPGRTMAQLSPEEKDSISHRAAALEKLKTKIGG